MYRKLLNSSLLLFLIALSNLQAPNIQASTSDTGLYQFIFDVDKDGFTKVRINFTSDSQGESWIFVPRHEFPNNSWIVFSGSIDNWEIVETTEIVGQDYLFYQVFKFSFSSVQSFSMSMWFNMNTGAMVIEPRGVFYSPQIGFCNENKGTAKVVLPENFKIDGRKAIASGLSSWKPKKIGLNYADFDLHENLVRLQIEFQTVVETPNMTTINQDVYTFQTPKRYEEYATTILNIYEKLNGDLAKLFNTVLEDITVTFFIPDFDVIFLLGGFVPFTSEEMGTIHINVFFVRYWEGIFEAVAVHELVHHFLWRANISPKVLWFHEGIAQMVSLKFVEDLGYGGASMEKQRTEEAAKRLEGKNLRFLQSWTPKDQPINVGMYYAASYYVVQQLAEEYGEFGYFGQFFKAIQNTQIENDETLAYHLSFAANTSVVPMLRNLGFAVIDLYMYSELIEEARESTENINPVLVPSRLLAEGLREYGLAKLAEGSHEIGSLFLELAIFTARQAFAITLLTFLQLMLVTMATIYYILKRRSHLKMKSNSKANIVPKDLFVGKTRSAKLYNSYLLISA